jgi:hypothetical protein
MRFVVLSLGAYVPTAGATSLCGKPLSAGGNFSGCSIKSGLVDWVTSFPNLRIRRAQANQGPRSKGEGMAIAGIVLGFIGAATIIIVIILAAAATHNPNPQY